MVSATADPLASHTRQLLVDLPSHRCCSAFCRRLSGLTRKWRLIFRLDLTGGADVQGVVWVCEVLGSELVTPGP